VALKLDAGQPGRNTQGMATDSPIQPGALEYSRSVFEHLMDWYKVADAKGRLLLTLNGIYITVLSSVALASPHNLINHKAALTPATWALLAGAAANTRDFRCLWRSGLLPLSSSVSVFESGCVVPPRECWHDFGPRVAAGLRAVPRSAAPGGRGGFSFLTVPASAAGYEKPGANTVTCGFPVTVCLVAVACRNFGRAF